MGHEISSECGIKSITAQRIHLRGIKNYPPHAVKFWDEGFGPLWLYQSADYDFGVIRAQTWEEAYECVEDEILPRATHEEMLRDFPGYTDPESMTEHDRDCFDESYGISGNNGYYHKPMNGECLEPLTPALCKKHGLMIRWHRYE